MIRILLPILFALKIMERSCQNNQKIPQAMQVADNKGQYNKISIYDPIIISPFFKQNI